MKPKGETPLTSLTKKLAASNFGIWFFAPLLHHLDAAVLGLTGGRRTLSGLVTGVPTVVVTTTGARTGKSRTLTLLRVPDETNPRVFAVIATNWARPRLPGWYLNLKANPRAVCSIDGRTGTYTAHEAGGAEYDRFWKGAVAIFPGYLGYKRRLADRRHIPIMVMQPDESPKT